VLGIFSLSVQTASAIMVVSRPSATSPVPRSSTSLAPRDAAQLRAEAVGASPRRLALLRWPPDKHVMSKTGTLPSQSAFFQAILRHLSGRPDGDRRTAIHEGTRPTSLTIERGIGVAHYRRSVCREWIWTTSNRNELRH
jgi:hypothetical protein